MSTDLQKALLAMDSYNRGYDEGIKLQEGEQVVNSYLGGFKIIQQSDFLLDSEGRNIGFYAIAYEYQGEVIISYRGTDQFFAANGIGGDVVNAFSQGGGDAETDQSRMAIQFYQDVVASLPTTYGLYEHPRVSVTGHSLGGGLAGLVGGGDIFRAYSSG